MAGVGVASWRAKGVKDRLQRFYLAGSPPRFESQSALARHLEISRSTVAGWFQGRPKVPEPTHMIAMAERDRLSPTWVLLELGPELIGAPLPQRETGQLLRESMVATIESRTGAAPEFLAWFIPSAAELWNEMIEDRLIRLREFLKARHAGGMRIVATGEGPGRAPRDAIFRAIRKYRTELDRWSPEELSAFKRRARRLRFPDGHRPGG